MSRSLQAVLIALVIITAFYFAVCSCNELYDIYWKLSRNRF